MHYEDREQLEKWAQIIEKAQADGKFKDLSKPPTPSPQTSKESFFGVQDTHPTERPTAPDAQYWKAVSEKSAHPYVLSEGIDPALAKEWRRQSGLTENVETQVGNVAKAIVQTPNPIRAHTAGKDQALEPGPLGLTFSEEDVKNLEAMKIQLHELECKLNDFEGRGQNGSKFEKQISSLKQRIDDLSTAMTQAFPYSISPQGD